MKEDKIKNLLKQMVSEEKIPGLDNTEKVTKDSKKHNDEYQKEVESKMSEYEKDTISNEDEDNVDVKVNATDDQKEYHDEMETLNGQEMINYDQTPSDKFQERAELAITGDSKMGNKTYTGKWNPETGEGNGNTEPVWGASDEKFGEKLVDRVKSSNKKRNDATQNITQFGDDIELGKPASVGTRKVAIKESNDPNKATKRLRFRKPINGVETALKIIPENYKKDDLVFEMTDGNETYKIRWEGTVTEGEAVVLESENKKLMSESKNRVMDLMNFNTKKAMGVRKSSERLQENKKFGDFMEKARMLNENGEFDYNKSDWTGNEGKISVNSQGEFEMNDMHIKVTDSNEIYVDGELIDDIKLHDMGGYFMASNWDGGITREHRNKYVAVAQLINNIF
jgi:hypothetical protein